MALFGKGDELFEIMGNTQAPALGTASQPPQQPTISWRFGRGGGPEGDFVEIDGDALVIVDDGWELAGDDAPPPASGRTFAIRADTLVVGGVLSLALVGSAFLLGRTSGEPAPGAETAAVAPAPAAEEAGPAAPEAPQPQQVAQVAAEAQPETPPSAQAPEAVTSTVAASFHGEAATLTTGQPAPTSSAPSAPQAGAQPTGAQPAGAQPAAAPRRPQNGRYVLVICTTTPSNAEKLAKWLNKEPRSPIFGRGDLEAYARRGVVRIRGFGQREKDVLARVKATSDPLGGSGTFHTAYYSSS